MSECLGEEIIQSYLDGELFSESLESVTSHLVSCSNCADLARELELENEAVAAALAPEFEASVPTERLRQRIDAALAGGNSASARRAEVGASSLREWMKSVSDRFAFSPQRAFAYSGLAAVLIVAFLFAVIQRYKSQTTPGIQVLAVNQGNDGLRPSPSIVAGAAVNTTAAIPPSTSLLPAGTETTQTGPRVYRTRNNAIRESSPRRDVSFANHVQLLPGERTYLQTIAALDSTIQQDKGRMKPAIQAEYERNLAFVDRALAAARTVAKNNPNDPDAAEFMFSAYQSKVDLLNTVADARVYDKQR